MSILRSKHSGWTWEGRRTPFGGPSGGGGPQQTTSYQTNLPEYAKPYVETMLGAAQKQAYKYDNSGNIVGFQPYVPYGATVGPGGEITNTAQEQAKAAVAGFSPMQEQAFGQVANPGPCGHGRAKSQCHAFACGQRGTTGLGGTHHGAGHSRRIHTSQPDVGGRRFGQLSDRVGLPSGCRLRSGGPHHPSPSLC